MPTVKFGGPVGVVRDPVSSAIVRPQVSGEATAESGEDEAIQQAILRAVSDTLAKAKASLIKIAEAPELAVRVAATAGEALGTKVEITSFTLTFSDDDLKALKS